MATEYLHIYTAINDFLITCVQISTKHGKNVPETSQKRFSMYRECVKRTYTKDKSNIKTQHLALFKLLLPKLTKNIKNSEDTLDFDWIEDGDYRLIFGTHSGNPSDKVSIDLSAFYKAIGERDEYLRIKWLKQFFNVFTYVSDDGAAVVETILVELTEKYEELAKTHTGGGFGSTMPTRDDLMAAVDPNNMNAALQGITGIMSDPNVMKTVTDLLTNVSSNPELTNMASTLKQRVDQFAMAQQQGPPQQLTIDEEAEEKE